METAAKKCVLHVQGPVSFDENGDRRGLTQIEQLQVDDEVQIGVYNPFSPHANKIQWDEHRTVRWKGYHSFVDSTFISLQQLKLLRLSLFKCAKANVI